MLPIKNISYLLPMCCSFWGKCNNSPKTDLGCSTPLMLTNTIRFMSKMLPGLGTEQCVALYSYSRLSYTCSTDFVSFVTRQRFCLIRSVCFMSISVCLPCLHEPPFWPAKHSTIDFIFFGCSLIFFFVVSVCMLTQWDDSTLVVWSCLCCAVRVPYRLLMQPSMHANLNSPSSRVVKDSTPSRRRILRCKNFGNRESSPTLFLNVVNLYLIKSYERWILNKRAFYCFIIFFIWQWILT